MIREHCIMCGQKIRMQIFKGTGVCCEQCRKDRDNDHEPFQPVNLKIT